MRLDNGELLIEGESAGEILDKLSEIQKLSRKVNSMSEKVSEVEKEEAPSEEPIETSDAFMD